MSIGDNAFFNTDLEGTLVLPATVTTISNSAFSNTQLNSLDISNAAALDSDSSVDLQLVFGSKLYRDQ